MHKNREVYLTHMAMEEVPSVSDDKELGSHECAKSRGRNRQVKNRDTHRPRDRLLIQDRIRELRDLIPNASKRSIDALLDQTVKHKMFLQSVHADKMSQSTRSKVGDKDSILKGSGLPKTRHICHVRRELIRNHSLLLLRILTSRIKCL